MEPVWVEVWVEVCVDVCKRDLFATEPQQIRVTLKNHSNWNLTTCRREYRSRADFFNCSRKWPWSSSTNIVELAGRNIIVSRIVIVPNSSHIRLRA